MTRFIVACFAAATVLFAGCASSPRSDPSTSPPAKAVDTVRIASVVAIPTEARRKLVLVMTGPAAVTGARDWSEFKREWRETFAEHAKDAGIAFAFSDTLQGATGEDGTILVVDVADYRMVGIGARIFFGVMTGNAYIEARATFTSLRDGSAYGDQQYSTSSSAWGGVFARVTPQQVDAIAANVLMDFKTAK